MTTIETPHPSVALAGDLRELIPLLSREGQARDLVRVISAERPVSPLMSADAELLSTSPAGGAS